MECGKLLHGEPIPPGPKKPDRLKDAINAVNPLMHTSLFDSDFDIIGRYGVRLYKIFRHMSFQITSWRLRVLLKREV